MPISPTRQIGSPHAAPPSAGRVIRLSPARACGLATIFALGLGAFGFLDVVRQNPAFQWSFFGPCAVLLAWSGVVFESARRTGRILTLEVALRKQHFVQAIAQAAFFLYWGWYWRPVYDSAFLIAAQLVFAYAFDMLLGWTRRDAYRFGFGPFPVIFSINLFLWFGDDWFYLQFLLVAIGFLAKEMLQWTKAGRRVHIFNPSSFALAIFSIALILTGTSDLTWGQDIATTQFFPPHAYLVLFLVALPGQVLFGVASMTMSAVVVTYAFGLLYFAVTGVYFFYDSYVPIAVFLGMHLLFTDPSTAPRTEVGRLIFGALYGLSTVALYAALSRAGVPPFYDKLLQVPLLNLSIQWLDRLAHSRGFRAFEPAAGAGAAVLRRRRLATAACWAIVFAGMSAVQGVGDRHPGQWVPFWQAACSEGRPDACRYLASMQLRFCDSGSAWACGEAEYLLSSGPGPREFDRARPTVEDYPIILRGTKGPITDRSTAALRARACSQGWVEACGRRPDDGGE